MASPADAEEGLRTALADRYRIEREIGSGGMATVYLAEDLKHHRQVAVKVLDPDLAESLGAERFLREIETAANLTHPHILPVFDSGEAGGFLFYVMPYVEGESLRTRLEKEKQLPVEDAVQIAREIADALAYAHDRGVIHRDVKPANILLEAGHAVLGDFGVAQAVAEAGGTRLTKTGVSLGTPTYMSPEQASGERELDGRSDQYALGCVLYEMLAGQPPFTGPQAESVVRQHLTAAPSDVTQFRPTVPRGVAGALGKALSKAPADRFVTTRELGEVLGGPHRIIPDGTAPARLPRRMVGWKPAALGAIGFAAVFAYFAWPGNQGTDLVENRVAVMAFENRTGDPDLDHLGRVAADWLTAGLVETRLLEVLPAQTALFSPEVRDATERVQNPGDLIRLVAEGTGARIVVAGSFSREGDSLRFLAQITDARRMTLLESVEAVGAAGAEMEGVATLRLEVMGALAAHLEPRLRAWRETARHTPSYEAYRIYMQAVEAFLESDFETAVTLDFQAHDVDTTFLLPLVHALATLVNLGEDQRRDSLLLFLSKRRTRLSEHERLHLEYHEAVQRGDLQGVLLSRRWIREWSPDAGGASYGVGWAALRVNRPREAIDAFRNVDPRRWDARAANWELWADACYLLGEHEEALRVSREGRELFPDRRSLMVNEARSLAVLGRKDEADSVFDDLLNQPVVETFTPGWAMVTVAAYLRGSGQAEEARLLLDRAVSWFGARSLNERGTEGRRYSLAQALYLSERWDEAREVFRELESEDPDNPDYLGYLGTLAAREGMVSEAQGISERLAGFDPTRWEATKWRAKIAAALGDKDRAVTLLQEAFSQGAYFGAFWLADMDLEPLRGYPPFEDFMRPRG